MTELAQTCAHVRVEDADGVRTLTFNRPDKKNALTHDMYAALAEAMADARENRSVRALVFTGAGDAFTAGNDMGDFAANPPRIDDQENPPPVALFLKELLEAPKPLIAAVNGLAVGVGFTMLLHCDLVYAAEGVMLRAPFVNLGLAPEAGSSLLLTERVGRARASEILLLGEAVDAGEAERLGIVARTFAPDRLLAETRARALAVAALAPTAVRETKRLLAGDLERVGARMTEEAIVFSRLLQSEEFSEAASAFFEKRPADFSRFG